MVGSVVDHVLGRGRELGVSLDDLVDGVQEVLLRHRLHFEEERREQMRGEEGGIFVGQEGFTFLLCLTANMPASVHTERMSAPVELGQRRARSSNRMSRSTDIDLV